MKQKTGELPQDGFAPLIVSIVIITVLSLITVGFVLLMENNQKNALNRQLNNDAYYAAQSGINDAIQAINNGYNQAKNACGPVKSNRFLSNNQVNGSSDYYSCLLINPEPSTLQYSSVKSSQPTVAVISTINPNTFQPENITSLEVSWQPSAQIATSPFYFAPSGWYPTCGSATGPCFPPEVEWQNAGHPIPGVIRVALTPLATGSLPTNTSTTYTGFFYPISGPSGAGSAPAYSSNTIGANSGELASGSCNNNSSSSSPTPEACNVTIDVSSANVSNFLMSLRSIYNPSQVTITAYNGSTVLLIRNAQTVIDSTGDDKGVLKRIQVRIPGLNDTGFPSYDLGSGMTVCKDLSAHPANATTGQPGGISTVCGL